VLVMLWDWVRYWVREERKVFKLETFNDDDDDDDED